LRFIRQNQKKMEKNLGSLDLLTLKALHEREAEELSKALLSGVNWNDLREQRQRVTDLAIAMHQKRQLGLGDHPASHATRSDRHG
jgi:hypothetical protein